MTGEYHQHQCSGKNSRIRWLGCAIIFLLLLTAAVLPGCLKIMKQTAAGQEPDGVSQNHTASPAAVSIHPGIPSTIQIHDQGMSSSSPDLISSALPELTPDPYPVQHATQINASNEPLRHVRLAEFQQTYVLRGNSTGLVVNATTLKGPLWIWFEVKPLYDCIEDPQSCRGKTEKDTSANPRSISLPYLTITVRDNQTREIVAEDGYGRIYSSQTTNRTIQIYREGRYHLTLTGDSVDVILAVATGAAPVLNETQQAAGSSQAKTLSPEILRRIRGGA
jgi:hypothetical protein